MRFRGNCTFSGMQLQGDCCGVGISYAAYVVGHIKYKAVERSEERVSGDADVPANLFYALLPGIFEPTRASEIVLHPMLSCQQGLSHFQKKFGFYSIAALGFVTLLMPATILLIITMSLWLIFALLIVWRLILVLIGFGLRLWPKVPRQVTPFKGTDLPVYSILIAVYREQGMMPQLARAMRQIVWPEDRLDIQILIEADDGETLLAAELADFPPGTRLVIVPPGAVKTKANALNFGLARVHGDYVCIYDAEDRPHPGQLLEAYRTFLSGGQDIACLQAPLVADNGSEALIAAHWGLEYATQFGLLMPAMEALNLPIPIGGTSNHFRVADLQMAQGWDAWNVTEDADLGLRFSRFGRRVRMLNLPTFEDAPTRLPVWWAQRSRWIKGFAQTWLVLMRRPGDLIKEIGWQKFLSIQLALGGAVVAPIFHGPVMLLVLLAAGSAEISLGVAGWSLLVVGLLTGVLSDVLAPGPWSFARLLAVLTRPFYWPLHTFSAVRALWELVVAPQFWAKTPHSPHKRAKTPSCYIGSS